MVNNFVGGSVLSYAGIKSQQGAAGKASSSSVKSVTGNSAQKTAGAKIGTDFGKMGTLVEKTKVEVNWSEYAEHGMKRLQERGMSKMQVNEIVKNGKVLSQNDGAKFAYITQDGVAVVSKEGKLVTTWGKDNFDDSMNKIIVDLLGK